MANKPQLTFARIVSGTVDTNGTGSGNISGGIAITQPTVATAVASATTTSAAVCNPITDINIAAIESENHTSATAPEGSGGAAAVATLLNSCGKNSDGASHQRFAEERKSDSDGNIHRPMQIVSHQNQHHQMRRNKPRPRNDRSRKDDNASSAGKEENETHAEQQPEVVLGPAPLPAVNAWFKQPVTETKDSKEESGVSNSRISSVKDEVNSEEISLSLKTMEADKDIITKSMVQNTLTSTDGNISKKMAGLHQSGQTTKQGEQLDIEATNVDDKAWPSLNEAVSEELKQDSTISNMSMKGAAVSHEVMKVIDAATNSSEADVRQDRDKENENNGNGIKSNRSGKAWKKLDIDVDYAGREGQGRRGNTGSGIKSDHPPKNSRRSSNFARQQTAKEQSNPPYGLITDPASTAEITSKVAPTLAAASLMGSAQPLSCIAPALMYSPECATASEEYAEEDYW